MIGALDEAEIDDVLGSATVARIGCGGDDGVYVVPVSYAYADGCVYAHSAPGKKLDLMRARPDVCLEVEDVRGPAEWRSVIAQGRYEELTGQRAADALRLLVHRFRQESPSSTATPAEADGAHGGDPGAGHGQGAAAPVLFRIRLHTRSGRAETRT